MPLPIAFVLSLVLHLALYTLADWAGMRAPPSPTPRPVIEAMLILPQIASQPAVAAAEPLPPTSDILATPVASTVTTPPTAPTVPPVAQPLPASPPTMAARVKPMPAPVMPPPVPGTEPPRFYPYEAVLRGLEGEVLVAVTLDAGGNVAAARVERSSGHVILDEAAVRAARTLQSLPTGRGEVVLPVRFRLR